MKAGHNSCGIAPVVNRGPGEITFRVDEVKVARQEVQTVSRVARVEETLSRRVAFLSERDSDLLGGWTEDLGEGGIHPLVSGVHRAFAEHHPLELRPDDFALAVAQGVAQHVHLHSERLRSRLVDHEAKAKIVIEVERFPGDDTAWAEAIDGFSGWVRDLVKPEVRDALGCDFSTTTAASRLAGEIALLDVFSCYFDYVMGCICGIPTITLRGTVDDWHKLLGRLDRLDGFDLAWWAARLRPLFEQLAASAEGRPDLEFWRAICKPKQAYGGECISGWITDLFPYLFARRGDAVPTLRNPMLDWNRHDDWVVRPDDAGNAEDFLGVPPGAFPLGLSEVPFAFVEPRGCQSEWAFVAGFLGLEQVARGTLRPVIGWAVSEQGKTGDARAQKRDRTWGSAAQFDLRGTAKINVQFAGDDFGLLARREKGV